MTPVIDTPGIFFPSLETTIEKVSAWLETRGFDIDGLDVDGTIIKQLVTDHYKHRSDAPRPGWYLDDAGLVISAAGWQWNNPGGNDYDALYPGSVVLISGDGAGTPKYTAVKTSADRWRVTTCDGALVLDQCNPQVVNDLAYAYGGRIMYRAGSYD